MKRKSYQLWIAIILLCFFIPLSLFAISRNTTAIEKYDIKNTCEHEWLNGECKICHQKCDHRFVNGVCMICERECSHDFKDGKCSICGLICEHEYENGVCKICGYQCPHVYHDEKGICAQCGEKIMHDYKGGKCVVCGAEPRRYGEMVSEKWLKPMAADKQGEIKEHNIVIGDGLQQRIVAYTPKGLNKNKQYNLVLILNEYGNSADEWMTVTHERTDSQWQMRNLYDHIMDEQLTNPFIVLSLEINSKNKEEIQEIISEYVIPWAIKYYPTYAKSDSYNDIIEARNHICLLGGNYTAEIIYKDLMPEMQNMIGNFMLFHTDHYNAETPEKLAKNAEYPLNYLYLECGTTKNVYDLNIALEDLATKVDYMVYDETLTGDIIDSVGNTWADWTTGFFNGIQLIF